MSNTLKNYQSEENFHNIEEISFQHNSSPNLDENKAESFYTPHQGDKGKKDEGINNKNINNSSKSTEEDEDMVKNAEPKIPSESKNEASFKSENIKENSSINKSKINKKKSLGTKKSKKFKSKNLRKKKDVSDYFSFIYILFGQKAYSKIFKRKRNKNGNSKIIVFKRKDSVKILENSGFLKEEKMINSENTDNIIINNIINIDNNFEFNEFNLEDLNNLFPPNNEEEENDVDALANICSNHDRFLPINGALEINNSVFPSDHLEATIFETNNLDNLLVTYNEEEEIDMDIIANICSNHDRSLPINGALEINDSVFPRDHLEATTFETNNYLC